MTCPGRDAVLRHALVGTQFFRCMVAMQFYHMPWSGCSFTTYLGRDTAIRHTCVMLQRGYSGDGCDLASTLCRYDS